jgi:predicted deacetylase
MQGSVERRDDPYLMAERPKRRLLVAIHDVCPRHEAEVDCLRDHLLGCGGERMAMLVVPNFWDRSPIVRGSAFAARLRAWAAEGVEMFLHGYVHRDDAQHTSRIARFKSRQLTAGEGEFLGLSHFEATVRIEMGRRLLEDVTGQPIAGFVAPAWLYGPSAKRALADAAIDLAENHWRVWNPATEATLAYSPVITWATRTQARMASSLAVASVARRLAPFRIMRVGVHPGDCGEPKVMSSIAETVSTLRRSRVVSRYADLKADAACAS